MIAPPTGIEDTMNFNFIEQVGDFCHYLTLAEIHAHTRSLADKPGFRVETIGHSRMGRDIELVSYGTGGRPTILLWGFEDPHEPICALSQRWLWAQLADANSPIHDLGHDWAFIPCLHPDGVLRNEQWFHHPGDLRMFLNWSWEEDNTFYGPPQSSEQFTLEEAIVRVRPELLFGMHDESHFPGHGYWALVSDEQVQDKLDVHFEYESRIGVLPVPAPVKPQGMRNSWYHGRAHGMTGRCLSMICEPRAYRRLKPPRDADDEVRAHFMSALSEYDSAVREVVPSSEDERALTQCAATCIERMQKEWLFFVCVGSCALRVLKTHGKDALADIIEQAFWDYLNARLDGTYTTIPIGDQVRIQLHFLFSVIEEAKGRKTFNSNRTE